MKISIVLALGMVLGALIAKGNVVSVFGETYHVQPDDVYFHTIAIEDPYTRVDFPIKTGLPDDGLVSITLENYSKHTVSIDRVGLKLPSRYCVAIDIEGRKYSYAALGKCLIDY